MTGESCAIQVCDRTARTRGLCAAHAQRQRDGYDLNSPIRQALPFDERYEVLADGCWEWTGSRSADGYGRYKSEWAHRVAFIEAGGAIPNGFHIDHLCRNRACVNPDHLEAVTPQTNLLRGQNRAAIVIREGKCIRGHERTPENIYTDKRGLNRCIPCERERRRVARAAS